jgi:eukaryotic-like serine/threonine-protein kinase
VPDTIKSDVEESLAPATEELVSWVIDPNGTEIADLIRRFPAVADLLRETAHYLVLEPTAPLTRAEAGAKPLGETHSNGSESSRSRSFATGTLARGRALDICRRFEADLKHGRGPQIEDCLDSVAEPQRSALLTMLLAAELRFRARHGVRPAPEEFFSRFADHRRLIEAVFITAVGPERIGPFGVVRLLGEGTFGRVYLCRDEQLDRMVAIKVPRADRFDGPQDLDRFLQEARLAARVKHPGIVAVHQVDRDKTVGCFLVLEYIEGRSLSALLHAESLTPRRAAQIVALVADALSYAHEQGLVHRDLKPDNILLDARDRPHIADFGLALHDDDRWPRRGEIAGTPPYMAPEQVRGESHRLDGRTDIWGIGVILYRMLTQHRPFHGNRMEEVFEDILDREPIPPRQRDRTIPAGLERICLKCLSKRMADRYPTAADLADDLRHWLRAGEAETIEGASTLGQRLPGAEHGGSSNITLTADSSVTPPVLMRPKGLRAFDNDDRDFFLSLLPGPRDRDGLPESLRFWKSRIEPGNHEDPFAVGLLCGHSGSGKTSMVKAGLLCHLSPADVISVYIEASPDATELRLNEALSRLAGGRSGSLSLSETVAGMRRRVLLPDGRKVFFVLDQFEQWLHAHHDQDAGSGELIWALRQCDGTGVQCLILVRDDFAMAAARFMRALEIRLVESHNFATVDPFNLVHARKVLREFGLAYDRLHGLEPAPFDRFLDQAVAELAEDGKIAPVRLALFAQMIKDKPWTPATLKEMRGLEGIGVRFLEESLDDNAANPEHRLNAQAARHVLRALLPDGAADIKGHMRSYEELLAASGYARRPDDFDRLLAILGNELRLITPTEPENKENGARTKEEQGGRPALEGPPSSFLFPSSPARYYHLTHDYLVPSLREWLTRKDRATIGGRAAIRLAERTAEWTARRSRRYMPAFWEWVVILLFTRRSRRSSPERRLVVAATRYHATRAALVTLAVALGCLLGYDRLGAVRARAAVRQLEYADPHNVSQVIRDLAPYRRWADPLLRQTTLKDENDARQYRARLALLPVDAAQASGLFDPLLDGDPDLFLVIRQALYDYGDRFALAGFCRDVVGNERESLDRRLRAGMTLAGLLAAQPGENETVLREAAGVLASLLVNDLLAHPDRYHDWLAAIHPARALLVPSLEHVFRGDSEPEGARSLSASLLANFAADAPETLTRLLVEANERQFSVIFDALSRYRATVVPALNDLITTVPPAAATRKEKSALAGRQANAAIALLHLGSPDSLWPLLSAREDPGLRSLLIDRIAPLGSSPAILVERLFHEQGPSARAALLLSLVRLDTNQLPHSRRSALAAQLLDLYRDDPDPAVHSAAGLLLLTWGFREQVRSAERSVLSPRPLGARHWYVAGDGLTMVCLEGKHNYRIGAPSDEPGWRNNESQYTVDIAPFEIAATEVTVGQFRAFLDHDPEIRSHYPAAVDPSPDLPQSHVIWYEAAAYCNWRSQQEGIPIDQWCYEPNADGHYAAGMKISADFRSKTGYRLPTEAEWEYACRAGTVTSRSFGDSDRLIVRYACCLMSAEERPIAAGSLLPNAFGLFDMHGNLFEWCQDAYGGARPVGATEEEVVDDKVERVIRGAGYYTRPSHVRSASRYKDPPTLRNDGGGFRLVRSRPGAHEL